MTVLQIRLKNCIQTIIEIEDALDESDRKNVFLSEMSYLKHILMRIDRLDVLEDDVERLEIATAKFLKELQISHAHIKNNRIFH